MFNLVYSFKFKTITKANLAKLIFPLYWRQTDIVCQVTGKDMLM